MHPLTKFLWFLCFVGAVYAIYAWMPADNPPEPSVTSAGPASSVDPPLHEITGEGVAINVTPGGTSIEKATRCQNTLLQNFPSLIVGDEGGVWCVIETALDEEGARALAERLKAEGKIGAYTLIIR